MKNIYLLYKVDNYSLPFVFWYTIYRHTPQEGALSTRTAITQERLHVIASNSIGKLVEYHSENGGEGDTHYACVSLICQRGPHVGGKRIQLWSVYKRAHQSVGHSGILKQRMRSGSPPHPRFRGERFNKLAVPVEVAPPPPPPPWRAAVDRASSRFFLKGKHKHTVIFIYLFGITLLKQWHTMYVNIGASIKTISKYNSYNSWYL